ncbi:glycosyltransferase [Candidatus Poribacteria bacterium]|nr:glycosyltransferase [Candidatus Poribacteria bacterium]
MRNRYPFVSIIIPTFNSGRYLRRCLNSLLALDYPKYEVIVVDEGSTDETLKIACSFPVRVLRKRKKNPAASRNLAASMAKGDILVFLDSDCEVNPSWLSSLVKVFLDGNGKVGIAGGPDIAPSDQSLWGRCVDYAVTSFVGTGGVRRGGRWRLAPYYPRGCNMAIPRFVFQEVEGFDESFDLGEDTEIAYRIHRKGYEIKYVPDAIVAHWRREGLKAFLTQIWGRGVSRVALGHKHRSLNCLAYKIPSILLIIFLALALASLVSESARRILITLSISYTGVLVASGIDGAIRLKGAGAIFLIPVIITLQHFTYGLAYLTAILKPLFRMFKETENEGNYHRSKTSSGIPNRNHHPRSSHKKNG